MLIPMVKHGVMYGKICFLITSIKLHCNVLMYHGTALNSTYRRAVASHTLHGAVGDPNTAVLIFWNAPQKCIARNADTNLSSVDVMKMSDRLS